MAATICRKHRAALGVAYEAGLRVAAVTVGTHPLTRQLNPFIRLSCQSPE